MTNNEPIEDIEYERLSRLAAAGYLVYLFAVIVAVCKAVVWLLAGALAWLVAVYTAEYLKGE